MILHKLRTVTSFEFLVCALRRYYEFITDPTPNFRKLGFFAWIYMALAIIETLIVIKVRVTCSVAPHMDRLPYLLCNPKPMQAETQCMLAVVCGVIVPALP